MPVIGGRDLKQRTLSAAVLAPVVLFITWLGGIPFAVLWTLAGLGALWEWSRIARTSPVPLLPVLGGLILIAGAILLELGEIRYCLMLTAAGILGCALAVRPRLWSGVGFFCAAIAALPVIVLRGADEVGFLAILFLFAVVWGTDIAAYFTGRALGGPKLWPRLSPNKTWSGAIGGAVFGTLAGVLVTLAGGLVFSPMLIVVGLALSVIGQAGDLAESAFKRAFGVKDASKLIPGHGGLLDRLDGFATATLAALLIAAGHGGASPAAGLLLW
ncbi:phosphatidate cytidylyltransferase [Azorhizobium oxalatiphilum]|uniref:Phosphatidate cytidylyltransferase n=1 Tax=Azorhizobium oxalatiphilum TaxID=980631 RepID=A0A917CD43_9HYPH|nr:phosphatidate cytidylyltransferase [Azorhizobium oxalatiphilum]GGF83864.1 phosphatidate cytidylyltransferase [Azorhizobium oxalatiphilum]